MCFCFAGAQQHCAFWAYVLATSRHIIAGAGDFETLGVSPSWLAVDAQGREWDFVDSEAICTGLIVLEKEDGHKPASNSCPRQREQFAGEELVWHALTDRCYDAETRIQIQTGSASIPARAVLVIRRQGCCRCRDREFKHQIVWHAEAALIYVRWVISNKCFGKRFLSALLVLAGSELIFVQSALGQAPGNVFAFGDYLVAPVRVHLLSAKEGDAIQTTLLETDITRILGKVNGVWAQAGLHFYLESVVCEEASHPEIYGAKATGVDPSELLELRPTGSKATNVVHIYYLKKMPMNGIFFPEAIFVKDTASLRNVAGGLDEPLPRVTSHELGHAFGLPHRQDTNNLMASGTTGAWLNEEEIKLARGSARKCGWIEPATDLMTKANTLFKTNRMEEAAEYYFRLATIPVKDQAVELAKSRSAWVQATRSSKAR